jgi:hypothetical protein
MEDALSAARALALRSARRRDGDRYLAATAPLGEQPRRGPGRALPAPAQRRRRAAAGGGAAGFGLTREYYAGAASGLAGRGVQSLCDAAGLRWHVQLRGSGPDLAAAARHRRVLAFLGAAGAAARAALQAGAIAPDLPGQGFTQLAPPSQCSLPGMSRAVAGCCEELDVNPRLLIGHSAGRCVASSLCLQGSCNPALLSASTAPAALRPRGGTGVQSRRALLASMPVFPQLVALHAVPRKPVERMLRQTGSAIPPEMVRCYRELLGSHGTSPAPCA